MANLDVMSAYAYNKSMDREKVVKRDRMVRGARSKGEMRMKLDPRYEMTVFISRKITETGRLDIGELKPKDLISGTLPSFVFRWDEKDSALDVDPENASKAEIVKFRRGTPEYYGHHTKKISSNGRVFEADIVWQGQKIYKGQISFNLDFEAVSFVSIGMTANASYSVEEASRLSKLSPQHIRYLLSKGEMLGKKLGRDWVVLSLDYMRKRKPKSKSK